MEQIKRTIVFGKPVFLLSGTHDGSRGYGRSRIAGSDIEAPEKLLETARRNPDAVAFGYVAGHWVAGA